MDAGDALDALDISILNPPSRFSRHRVYKRLDTHTRAHSKAFPKSVPSPFSYRLFLLRRMKVYLNLALCTVYRRVCPIYHFLFSQTTFFHSVEEQRIFCRCVFFFGGRRDRHQLPSLDTGDCPRRQRAQAKQNKKQKQLACTSRFKSVRERERERGY